MRTIGAEDSGSEGAACAQQLPADSCAYGAHVFCHERHHVAILVQHCVSIGLLKAQDDCAPASAEIQITSPPAEGSR